MLHGSEIRILALWEKSRLRIFEDRILRRVFRPNSDVNGEWRRLHNKELHSSLLYCSPSIVKVIKYGILRLTRLVVRMEKR